MVYLVIHCNEMTYQKPLPFPTELLIINILNRLLIVFSKVIFLFLNFIFIPHSHHDEFVQLIDSFRNSNENLNSNENENENENCNFVFKPK